MHRKVRILPTWSLTIALAALFVFAVPAMAQAQSVVINEVAWMGTTVSTSDEWIELHSPTGAAVDLTGLTLAATDGTPSITLSGTVGAYGYFLLERTDDSTVPGVAADQIYSGAMGNSGEVLELRDFASSLVDSVDAWYAGDNTIKAAMSRISAARGRAGGLGPARPAGDPRLRRRTRPGAVAPGLPPWLA